MTANTATASHAASFIPASDFHFAVLVNGHVYDVAPDSRTAAYCAADVARNHANVTVRLPLRVFGAQL